MKFYGSTIQKGSKGDDVKKWQSFLNTQGYGLSVDGDFGDKTYAATTDYQSKNGLGADGIVDKYADCVKTSCQCCSIHIQSGFKIFDFDSQWNRIPVKTGDIVGFGIKKSKLHKSFLLFVSIILYR